jgi:aspartyl-tRNA(Asn)/glutamyl-tRNA(Gln) amidotransferase subunit A
VDFRAETVADLAARVARREVSARELVDAALARIEEHDGVVNAFVALDADSALTVAADIDQRLARGDDVGVLAGIPLAVKDLEDATGFVTTHGSALHRDDHPATRDSLLVERLRAAGCVVIGKTNTPEQGWKADTENPTFGATRNPWNLQRSAGGSSGGSAAAIAAGMVPLATGSDGGGSIRIPSAACGLSGLKPSLGRVPGGGPTPPGWLDLSTRGVMARRIRDVATALDAVLGPDPSDLRSLPMPEVSWSRSLQELHPPRRVGWSPTLGYAEVDPEVRAVCERAVRVLEGLGTEVVEIDTVFAEDPVWDWLRIAAMGCARALAHARRTERWAEVDSGLRAQVEWAESSVSALDLLRAIDACHLANLRLVELFHEVPLLLTPTCAGQLGSPGAQGTIDGRVEANWVRFTYPFNMTRSPAGTVCAGFTDDGMPVGLQVVGPQHADVAVLRLVAVLEDALAIDTVAPLP